MCYLAQNLNDEIFETTLLVIEDNKNPSFQIKEINLVFLNKKRVLHGFWPVFKFLYKTEPNIVVSSISHLNILMALESIWFRKIKFIGRESSILSIIPKTRSSKNNFKLSIIPSSKRSLKLLDIILCQSQDMALDMINNFDISKNKIKIINNPISDLFTPKKKKPENKILKFITVGRLVKVKGHDRILKALSKFNKAFEYLIIGDSDEEMATANKIFELVKELKLDGNINYIPFSENVSNYLKECDVFLQGSYSEGFPNALLESCAVGTPVLAFDALGGTKEIVENGINGFIVKDENDFLSKLNLITEKKWNPIEVSNSVFKKFNKDKIIKEYENLFLSLLKK